MRRLGLVVACVGLLPVARVLAEDPVDIPDPALKAAIEEALGLVDPTPMDMLELDRLEAPMRCISDLTGLHYATHLQWLDVSRGNSNGGAGIWDISPLSGLTNLKHLNLNNNYISDLSALSGMDLLEYLDIHDNRVSDLSPLAGKTRLHTAYLYRQWDQTGDLLTDISVLAGLWNLSTLHLEENHISDLSPLANLMSLTDLNVTSNPLNDEACSVYIPLIIEHNPGVYIAYRPCGPLCLTLSSTPGGSVTAPGEGTFTYAYGSTVPLVAKADSGFIFSHWSGTQYSTTSPMHTTMDQDHEIRAHFLSTRDVLVVDDDAPGDPGPGDATLSDPQEDGTPARPLDSVQEAIDVAAHGTSVVVRTGTYREQVDLLGKPIRVLGIDLNSPQPASYPVLDGDGQGPVVCFSGGENPQCTLEGFVVTRGRGHWAGAIYCVNSSPTIAHCLIVGNRVTQSYGAAVFCQDSAATFHHCTIADNQGGEGGAGLILVNSPVVLTHSTVWGNGPKEMLVKGSASLTVAYSDLAGAWAGLGNIASDPLFVQRGHWGDPSDPSRWREAVDTQAIWVDGDYHLRSQAGRWDSGAQTWVQDGVTSPCIDAGSPAHSVGSEPIPNGGLVNLGAYGGTAQASMSPD